MRTTTSFKTPLRSRQRVTAGFDSKLFSVALAFFENVGAPATFAALSSAPSDGKTRNMEESFDFGLQRVLIRN